MVTISLKETELGEIAQMLSREIRESLTAQIRVEILKKLKSKSQSRFQKSFIQSKITEIWTSYPSIAPKKRVPK